MNLQHGLSYVWRIVAALTVAAGLLFLLLAPIAMHDEFRPRLEASRP